MRSSIDKLSPILNLNVNLDQKLARFNFDSKKVPLQKLVKQVTDASKNFKATVVFHAKGSKSSIKEAHVAITKLKGVKKVSEQDKDGLIHITLDPKGETMFATLVETAKKSGVTLSDVAKKK